MRKSLDAKSLIFISFAIIIYLFTVMSLVSGCAMDNEQALEVKTKAELQSKIDLQAKTIIKLQTDLKAALTMVNKLKTDLSNKQVGLINLSGSAWGVIAVVIVGAVVVSIGGTNHVHRRRMAKRISGSG